ncbi:MAG TPA: hypothetical protein VN802_01920 [Stellaceae bacterium]|nr:hypothetical protein [Stellaceae bacterium]
MATELRDLTITRPNRQGEVHLPTEFRAEPFLRALASVGTVRGACRSLNMSPSSVHSLRRRSPEFRLQVQEAMSAFSDLLHERARSLAMGEVMRPQYFEGKVVGNHPAVDSATASVLLRLLERHDRSWAMSRNLNVNTTTDHGEAALRISLSEFGKLSHESKEAMKSVLLELRSIRAGQEGTVVDVEVETEPDDDGLSDEDRQTLAEINS